MNAWIPSLSIAICAAVSAAPPAMEKIRISDDGAGFVESESGKPFTPWGFNFVGRFGEIIEDSWHNEWLRLAEDFREMRALGANVVRIHLQFGTYMPGPGESNRGEFDKAQLDRLRNLLDLARENDLYLDLTGLNLFRLADIPAWYDKLDEAARWDVQARWWAKIAETCAGHPAVFCYDLVNEPLPGGSPSKDGEPRWVGGELAGFYFVQKLTDDARGRTGTEIAAEWTKKLTTAIRAKDPKTPITVGVIPWAQLWPTAKPVFYAPEAAKYFDFVSIHLYPGHDKVKDALHAIDVYEIGKPLVVEETFPLNCTITEMELLIDGGRDRVDGWISHYFGHTIAEHRAGAEPHGTAPDAPFKVAVADFLEFWRAKGMTITAAPQAARPAPDAPLVVRGSVEQIHVVHALPDCEVTVRGPGGFAADARTDRIGGLVIADVPPGDGYRVTVGGGEHTVRVLARDDHPPAEFYASQKLEPAHGYLKTRDGTLLAYRVELPDPEQHGPGPYDLVITYSGYQPSLEHENGHQNMAFENFNALGYAVAGVNMRGSACSGGAFRFMEPLTWLDGYDMVEAFSAQNWVDDVALGDQSWPGLTQLYVASTRPPSLDAIVAGSVVGDFYRDVFYPGGIENTGFGHIWAGGRDAQNAWPSQRDDVMSRIASDPVAAANQGLRGQNVSLLQTIRTHPFDDAYWQRRAAENLVAKITIPTLQTVSWQDPQVGGRPAMLQSKFSPDTPMRLVGINGFHQYYSGAMWDEIAEFLHIYLDESPADKIAAYEAENSCVVLVESDSKGNVRGRFSLADIAAAGDGRRMTFGADLAPGNPDPGARSSSYSSDESKPGSWKNPLQDQVAFTSEPLDNTLVLAGPGSVDLWIAADANDVDLQVTLSEVRPDGQEMLVQSGWIRASHRALDESASTPIRPVQLHTKAAAKPLVPGELTQMRIELFPFAHVFRKGSRIRVIVSGPGGAGNGWPWKFDELPGKTVVRIVHDGGAHSSSIVLPVVHPDDLTVPESLPEPESVWLQPCRPKK